MCRRGGGGLGRDGGVEALPAHPHQRHPCRRKWQAQRWELPCGHATAFTATVCHAVTASPLRSRHSRCGQCQSQQRRCGHGIAVTATPAAGSAAAVTATPAAGSATAVTASPLRSRHRRCEHGNAAAVTATPLRSWQRRCGDGNAAAVTATRSRRSCHGTVAELMAGLPAIPFPHTPHHKNAPPRRSPRRHATPPPGAAAA